MYSKLLYVGLLLMIVVGMASYCVVKASKPPVSVKPEMVNSVPAGHQNSKLPLLFDPTLVSYQAPKAWRALQFFDRESRRHAAPDWEKLAPEKYPCTETSNKFSQEYRQTYRAIWESGEKPTSSTDPRRWSRSYQVYVELSETLPMLTEFTFFCTLSKEHAWSVFWDCSINQDLPIRRCVFCFWHPEIQYCDERGEIRPYLFYLGPLENTFHADNDWTSEEREEWEKFCRSHDQLNTRRQPKSILRYWESPESFEAAVLEELAVYDQLLTRWFVESAHLKRRAPYRGGGIPPHELPPLITPLGKRIRVLFFASLVNQVRRKQFQQYAPEMHRVLVESFPKMPELLQQLQAPAKP